MSTVMEAEMREQPEVLTTNAQRYYEEFNALGHLPLPSMVVIAARGSSDNAAHYLRYLVEIILGVPVCLAAPSVVTVKGVKVHFPSDAWVIGISQSGSAPDVCEYLDAARTMGCNTIGITNVAASRLTQSSDICVLLEAGEEKAIPATKTYTASLLACYQLVRAVMPGLPDPTAQMPNEVWMQACAESASKQIGFATHLDKPVFAIGRLYSFATALETSLKLMETAQVSCKGYSTADFQHGPKALASSQSTVIDFTRTAFLSHPVQRVSPPSVPQAVDEALVPIWDAVFGQYLALKAAEARGLDPDSPQFLTKVTSTL